MCFIRLVMSSSLWRHTGHVISLIWTQVQSSQSSSSSDSSFLPPYQEARFPKVSPCSLISNRSLISPCSLIFSYIMLLPCSSIFPCSLISTSSESESQGASSMHSWQMWPNSSLSCINMMCFIRSAISSSRWRQTGHVISLIWTQLHSSQSSSPSDSSFLPPYQEARFSNVSPCSLISNCFLISPCSLISS